MSPQELRRQLEFYKDLGIKEIYRRVPVFVTPPAEMKPIDIDIPLPSLVPDGDTLDRICADIGDCTRCRLHKGRNKIVFGVGDPVAKLVFVGEGPGADEDAQGIPFVGRAGQLLNNMIAAMGLKREEVYIANVVKCRP